MSDEQVAETFRHFCGHFQRSPHDSYFDLWINILDGIEPGGSRHTFAGGGICCVDLIKYPTMDAWGNVVRGPDKHLIYGCFSGDGMQRYWRGRWNRTTPVSLSSPPAWAHPRGGPEEETREKQRAGHRKQPLAAMRFWMSPT